MVVTRACNQKFYKIVKRRNNGITSKIKFRFKVANNVLPKLIYTTRLQSGFVEQL